MKYIVRIFVFLPALAMFMILGIMYTILFLWHLNYKKVEKTLDYIVDETWYGEILEAYMNTAKKIMPFLLIVLVSSCSYKYQYVARSADILIHKGRARTIWKSDSVEVIPDDSIIRVKLVYKKPVKDK